MHEKWKFIRAYSGLQIYSSEAIRVWKYSLITYLHTHSRSWALLEEPPIVQPLKNFPAYYGTRRFNTVFTRALHWSLSWARWIQSKPSHPISVRSILILSTHLRLDLISGLFPSGFPPITYMPCPSRPLWLDNSNYAWRRVQVMKLLIMQFSPTSRHIISLRSKYSPQYPVLNRRPFISVTKFPGPRLLVIFRNNIIFYRELLAPRPTPKLCLLSATAYSI
jgi:hypothetical protein